VCALSRLLQSPRRGWPPDSRRAGRSRRLKCARPTARPGIQPRRASAMPTRPRSRSGELVGSRPPCVVERARRFHPSHLVGDAAPAARWACPRRVSRGYGPSPRENRLRSRRSPAELPSPAPGWVSSPLDSCNSRQQFRRQYRPLMRRRDSSSPAQPHQSRSQARPRNNNCQAPCRTRSPNTED